MLRELLKTNLNNSVNIQVAKNLYGRFVVPVVFFCILIVIIKQKEVVIGDENAFPDVLLGHECGSDDSIVAVFEHSLHGYNISYFGDKTVLDGYVWVALDILLGIKCQDEDHNGLGLTVVAVPE